MSSWHRRTPASRNHGRPISPSTAVEPGRRGEHATHILSRARVTDVEGLTDSIGTAQRRYPI